ncbi:MAG: hypothetical protein N838_10705 [Thiohalocapsa sp. PB-PSB1]|jgi:hypothetical protein|nr:MAG: hypothetical protein N838_10705 [Thiohalocapsa sp. PB-PSB1]
MTTATESMAITGMIIRMIIGAIAGGTSLPFDPKARRDDFEPSLEAAGRQAASEQYNACMTATAQPHAWRAPAPMPLPRQTPHGG